MKYFISYWVLLLTVTASYGQQQYQALLDSVVTQGGIVLIKPAKTLGLIGMLWGYYENIQDFREPVDSALITEIVNSQQSLATTEWKQGEMPFVIMVANESDPINKRHIKKQLHRMPKSFRSIAIKNIRIHNDMSADKRVAKAYSRPIFFRGGQYAVIRGDFRYGYNVSLYHLTGSCWRYVGGIENVRY